MGLFNKKICDICGGEIGLLGNRKLSNGNLCKDCARKLSPWMSDRRQSTVDEIRQHLAYRDQNRRMVAGFHPTAAIGTNTKVYIDAPSQRFIVTSQANWKDNNPDIISFSQVIDVCTEVTEHHEEIYHRNPEGKNVSFTPPRYRYSYEFRTTLLIDSPYFNEIRFELTDKRPERMDSDEYRYYEQMANDLRAALMPLAAAPTPKQGLAQSLSDAFGKVVANAVAAGAAAAPRAEDERWTCACGSVNDGNFCPQCGAKRPEKPKLFRCDKCGWTPENPAHPPKFCPNCGDPFNASDAL